VLKRTIVVEEPQMIEPEQPCYLDRK